MMMDMETMSPPTAKPAATLPFAACRSSDVVPDTTLSSSLGLASDARTSFEDPSTNGMEVTQSTMRQ